MERKKEFGDFQTPSILAEKITKILSKKAISPEMLVEPTCGLGSILLSANSCFRPVKSLGIEIQSYYINILSKKIEKNTILLNADFFKSKEYIKEFIGDSQKILFIGNPPWVTNTTLSSESSNNLPTKTNIDNIRGIEAITGKSNFDISEYIIRELIHNFYSLKSTYAFLCKTSVAKKIMNNLWKNKIKYNYAELYPIDAKKYFNAAVEACLFIIDFTIKQNNSELLIYDSIESEALVRTCGYINGAYLENTKQKECLEFYGISPFVWRNGVKHDCSKVVELEDNNGEFKNGYQQIVDIESDLVFPFLKSSDIANDNKSYNKKILITQTFINEPTNYIEKKFPKTWTYLNKYSSDFAKRKSVIYKNKNQFSIFSVGDYTFRPYKIAISGFYKILHFKIIEPYKGKTVLLDDTCNFISFNTKEEAAFVYKLLTSKPAMNYLSSRISWESKRPIKTEILNSLDLLKIAKSLKIENDFHSLFGKEIQQNLLFT